MKRRLIKFLIFSLGVLLPLTLILILAEALPNPYAETYLGAFQNKYDNLYKAEGKKLVFIGGSSLPFGLDSALLEDDLGGEYTVINYGLYATLGTKFMLDTSLDAIGEGDIVVIAPELSLQTYSLYFNPEAVLEATDGFSPMLSGVTASDKLSLFYRNFVFAFDKLGYALRGETLSPSGIYAKSSLNARGDMAIWRENNIMNGGYDANMTVTLDETLLNDEFINYINAYVANASARGASIYFSFAPTNVAALRTSENARAEFENALAEMLDCELLLPIEKAIVDKRYCYDTNFHLNSAGQTYFTRVLSLALKEKLSLPLETAIEIPTPPALPDNTVIEVPTNPDKIPFAEYTGDGNIDYVDYFLYEKTGDTYKIVGVKPAYYGMTEVILPSVYEGKNVTALAGDALSLCTDLVAVHIGKSYKSLEAFAFRGCISLRAIYLYEEDGSRILPPSENLLSGASHSVTFYIPENSNYSTGYVWSSYEDKMAYFAPYREVQP